MANKDDYHRKSPSGNWEPDPYHRHDQRWWSGTKWSGKVRSDRQTQIDPPGVIPKPVSHDNPKGPVDPIENLRPPLRNASPYVPHLLIFGFLLLFGVTFLALLATTI